MTEGLSRDELLNAGRQRLRTFQRRQSLNQQRRYSIDQSMDDDGPQPTESISVRLSESRHRHSLPTRIVTMARRSNSLKHNRSNSNGASSLLSPTLTVSSVGSTQLSTVQEDRLAPSFGDQSLPSPPADPRPQGNAFLRRNGDDDDEFHNDDPTPTPLGSEPIEPEPEPEPKDQCPIATNLASRFPVTLAIQSSGTPKNNLEESLIWIRQNARLSDERQQILKELEKEKEENKRIQHELDELRHLHRATQRSWSRINEDLHTQLRLVTQQKQSLVADKGFTSAKEVMLNEMDQLRQDLDQRDDLIGHLFSRHVGHSDSETNSHDSYDNSSQEPPVIFPPSEDTKRQLQRLREERDAWKQVARNLEMRVVELSGRSGNGH